MAPSVFLLYILFTTGFSTKWSTGILQLELGVRFLEEPKNVIGVKGRPLSLPCRPRADHQKEILNIKWYHNNKLMDLTRDKRRTAFENGTLYFSKLVHKRAGHSDQGEYRCVVTRKNGSLSSKPGFLRISVLPENFSHQPVEQNVEIGSIVRFSCEIDYFPELEIDWTKDEKKLPHNEIKYVIITGPDVSGSILYIFNVMPDDSGSYRCTARNILLNKQRHSSSGLLTVLPRAEGKGLSYKPFSFLSAQPFSFSPLLKNVREVKEGDNITLDCAANGSPTPILEWTFFPFDQSKPQQFFNKTNAGYNIMLIKNITRDQAGRYTCTAKNSSKREITTEVKVLTAPDIQGKWENIVFRASKTVRFRCIASGNPLPEINWLKDGDVFNITGRIKHRTSVNESQQLKLSELILSSTVTSDAGIYQCMAKNSIGAIWAASQLFLNATQPAPGAPEKVFCESISSSQIKLTWDVPSTVDKIIAFSIHYHPTDNGEEMQKVMASDFRSTQIDKLLPFTNYTFYVRLYIDSASEFSEKTICQTGEEVPVEAPTKQLKIISPNSVHVSWLPLSKQKARGIVTQYKIQWRNTGSPSSRAEQVTSDVLDYTITGLIRGNKYDVRVLAATSEGWPETDLPWETFEIPLNYNLDLPSAPEIALLAINSSSVEVKWSIPARGKDIVGYKIFYRKHHSKQIGPIIVPPDAKQFIITGLDPETWYEVMVLGFTKENNGETGISSVHTLSKKSPSNLQPLDYSSIIEPPISVEANPVSPTSIHLSWSLPQVISGSFNIKYYTICYSMLQTSRNKNAAAACLQSLGNTILIDGLTPFTLYEFKVKAHDINNKQSAFSQVVECYTLEDVPSQVIDMTWVALNKTTVQVNWKEPPQNNGVIKNYTIYYTQDFTLPLKLWDAKVVSANDCRVLLTELTSNVKYYFIIRASTNAGLGSYGSPKQFLIPSPIGVTRDQTRDVPKTSKDKQSDHYIGIMVGLGIGMCCIILCTTCILCRRRCLKEQVPQEFEITSSRHSNGNDSHRNRELVAESREAEYFTFLSSQRERPNVLEVSVQHLDSKGHYPNGSAGGIRMSLFNNRRMSSGSEKANIYITENPRYDPNCSDSPLLNPRVSSSHTSESSEHFDFLGGRQNSSKTLSSERQNFSGSVTCSSLNNNEFALSKENDKSLNRDERGSSSQVQAIENEDEQWVNLNNVLKNPDFRFSDFKSSGDLCDRTIHWVGNQSGECGKLLQCPPSLSLERTRGAYLHSSATIPSSPKGSACVEVKDVPLTSSYFPTFQVDRGSPPRLPTMLVNVIQNSAGVAYRISNQTAEFIKIIST